MKNNVNIVLVHGAWADATCWSKVILLLREKGYKVTAVQNPLTSLEADIAVTKRYLSDLSGPTVLVGHSYGGAVITGAASAPGPVGALVYITAFGLDQGESLKSLSESGTPSPGSSAIEPDRHEQLWINRDKFHSAFAADATPDEAAVMATVQKPFSFASFAGEEITPAWKSIPSWYLVCTDDQMIPPLAQEFMAKRMGATIRHSPSSHSPFMSHPRDVLELIVLAADSIAN